MRKIIKWFKNIKAQKDAENDLVDAIIKSMREEPEKWNIDRYVAEYGGLVIWITNSPYADMKINDRRLPRRDELRKALAFCLMEKYSKTFN